jgi:hypothetical protein
MKITNDGSDERVYPTLGVILEPGESFDDAKNTKVTPSTVTIIPSAASDSTVEEVK